MSDVAATNCGCDCGCGCGTGGNGCNLIWLILILCCCGGGGGGCFDHNNCGGGCGCGCGSGSGCDFIWIILLLCCCGGGGGGFCCQFPPLRILYKRQIKQGVASSLPVFSIFQSLQNQEIHRHCRFPGSCLHILFCPAFFSNIHHLSHKPRFHRSLNGYTWISLSFHIINICSVQALAHPITSQLKYVALFAVPLHKLKQRMKRPVERYEPI